MDSFSGRAIVFTAGTRVQLDPGGVIVFSSISIIALHSNTSIIYVGDSGTTATLGSENGYPLKPGIGVIVEEALLTGRSIWIDARVSGEGVTWWGVP